MAKSFDMFEGMELDDEDLKFVKEVKISTMIISRIKKKNLSPEVLHKLTGLKKRKIEKIFNGETDPLLSEVIKLCIACDLNLQIEEN